MIKYFTSFTYGNPNLARGEVTETPRTYTIHDWKELMGYIYAYKRINKGKYHAHDSLGDALMWLEQRTQKHIESLYKQIVRAQNTIVKLQEFADKEA